MNFKTVAVKAAKEAGKIHLKYFNSDIKVKYKSANYDRVTVADVESEKKIVSIIRKSFPSHNILGEEGKYKDTGSAYRWIIDPLDGTNNFSKGLPIFSCSIALAKDGEIILGVVYDAIKKELFVAELSKGATLNGKKISVSKHDTIKESLLVTGFYYDRGSPMLKNLVNIKHFFLNEILGLRRLGSAALDLCYVAAGRVDGFWEFILNPWDFAAGKLIIEEAGGRVSNRTNEEVKVKASYIVASNSLIHDEMIKIINK
jgi:myo-inositol-1(or 4)-monophosphatase